MRSSSAYYFVEDFCMVWKQLHVFPFLPHFNNSSSTVGYYKSLLHCYANYYYHLYSYTFLVQFMSTINKVFNSIQLEENIHPGCERGGKNQQRSPSACAEVIYHHLDFWMLKVSNSKYSWTGKTNIVSKIILTA